MRLLVGIFTLLAISSTASMAVAGENGSFLSCKSESGLTVLNIGNIDSALNPRSVQLTIEGQTLGNLVVGAAVDEIVVGKLTLFRDIAQGEIILGIKSVPVSEVEAASGVSRLQIFKGIDPRKGKELDFNIDVVCQTVYNPI